MSGTVNNTNPANAASAVASLIETGGFSGFANVAVTITTTGTYVVQASNSGISIGGSPIFMGAFQIETGSAFTGFRPNTPAQTQGNDAGTTSHSAASSQVQATVTSTSGAEGSFLTSAAVARRHIAGNTTFNFLFNPTAALNTQGWATSDGTAHASFGRDTTWGGRFVIVVPSGSLAGVNALYYQTVTTLVSTTYAVSGNVYLNAVPSGGCAYVDAFDGSTTLGESVPLTIASNALVPFSFTFTTSASDTSIEIRLIVYTGGTSPSSATSAAFSALKCEYGTVSTPHSDDTTTSVVTATHAPTPGTTDGSYLLPNQISARHMLGAPATDQGAVLDSSGLVLPTRHSVAVQATVAPTAASDGSYLQPNVVTRRHAAGTTGPNLVYNPTGRLSTKGWTAYNGTGTASFASSNFLGGRFLVSVPVATSYSPNNFAWFSQSVPVYAGYTYTLSGLVEYDGTAGSSVTLDCGDNLSNYYYCAAVTTPGSGQVPSSVTFTTPAGVTEVTIRLRVSMGTGSSGSVQGYFYAIQLELGNASSLFGDHTITNLATQSHDAVAGGEGSFLTAGQISGAPYVWGKPERLGRDGRLIVAHALRAPRARDNGRYQLVRAGAFVGVPRVPILGTADGLEPRDHELAILERDVVRELRRDAGRDVLKDRRVVERVDGLLPERRHTRRERGLADRVRRGTQRDGPAQPSHAEHELLLQRVRLREHRERVALLHAERAHGQRSRRDLR